LLRINGLKIDEGRDGEHPQIDGEMQEKDNAETQSTLRIAEVPHTPGVLREEFGFAWWQRG
jgi:hypothetical protein